MTNKTRTSLWFGCLATFCFALSQCRHSPLTEDQVLVRDGLTYAKGEEEPFTGTLVSFYLNGFKKEETKYRRGKKHGESTKWWANGSIKSEGVYKDGKLDGLIVERSWRGIQKSTYRDGALVEESFRSVTKPLINPETIEKLHNGRFVDWRRLSQREKTSITLDYCRARSGGSISKDDLVRRVNILVSCIDLAARNSSPGGPLEFFSLKDIVEICIESEFDDM